MRQPLQLCRGGSDDAWMAVPDIEYADPSNEIEVFDPGSVPQPRAT